MTYFMNGRFFVWSALGLYCNASVISHFEREAVPRTGRYIKLIKYISEKNTESWEYAYLGESPKALLCSRFCIG